MSFKAGRYQIDQLISNRLLEIGDGYRAKNCELSSSGVPFARAANINGGFKFDSADYLPLDAIAKTGNKVSRPGDVVFTSKGTVGRFALVEAGTQRFVYSPQLCFWRSLDQDKLLPEYLYYWMNSEEFLHQISYLKGQTDMADYVSLRDQRKISATIPATAIQRSIVDILKPLDDRIALLRETNATLEAIAQALFKSWFVDFDPVRAKQEGREPEGMDSETAALFPDSFEESELGLVPKEWHYCSLKDAVSIFDSKRIPLSGQDRAKRQGQYPYHGAAALMDHVDDFLFDGVYFLMGEDGSVADTDGHPIIQYVWGKFWVNNHAHILQGKNGVCTEHAMLFAKRTNIKPFMTGAVQAKLSQSNMWRIPFLMPTKPISESFGELIAPLFIRFRHNSDQCQTLAALRDTLLPRLISGQLRLPEAEKLTEEVTA